MGKKTQENCGDRSCQNTWRSSTRVEHDEWWRLSRPRRPYEMLSDLYLCYQYYLVNKLTLTQGVQIFLSKVVWSITAKNTDCSTGPLARPFARSLAPLTRSLAPDCSLRSRPPLRSLVRSLAHFAHSLARGTVNDWMAILSVFFSIFDHSAQLEN